MQLTDSLQFLAVISLLVASSSQAAVLPAQEAANAAIISKRHESTLDTHQDNASINNFLASLFGSSSITNGPEHLSENSPPQSTRFAEFLRLISTPKTPIVTDPTEPIIPDSIVPKASPAPPADPQPPAAVKQPVLSTSLDGSPAGINAISNLAPSTKKDHAILQQAQKSGSQLPANAKYATSGPSVIRFDQTSQRLKAEMDALSKISPSTEKDAAILQDLQRSGSALPANARYATSGPSAIRFSPRSFQAKERTQI